MNNIGLYIALLTMSNLKQNLTKILKYAKLNYKIKNQKKLFENKIKML